MYVYILIYCTSLSPTKRIIYHIFPPEAMLQMKSYVLQQTNATAPGY